jgi:uncharacterized protein
VHSAIYSGSIRHRRYFPNAHAFNYPIFMSYMDLDELPQLFKGRWFFSLNRLNLVCFLRKDFLDPEKADLKQAVLDRVEEKTGQRPLGPVRLLTHLRYFGLSFNPVSFYYCFEADGKTVHSIVAEITNTPWKERFAYVLPIAQADTHGSAWHWQFDKAFHVSPFLPMQMHYSWRFQNPEQHLRVHMIVCPQDDLTSLADQATRQTIQFDSTLVLAQQSWNSVNLRRALLRFPFITLGVMFKIYWHALLLKLKRNPFFDHPKTS